LCRSLGTGGTSEEHNITATEFKGESQMGKPKPDYRHSYWQLRRKLREDIDRIRGRIYAGKMRELQEALLEFDELLADEERNRPPQKFRYRGSVND
jgi:hypothetical protein